MRKIKSPGLIPYASAGPVAGRGERDGRGVAWHVFTFYSSSSSSMITWP
ncbi:MAG: hypothetical protein IKZ43_09745 [Acidaminococcaceae bacterium]|nr:hypothetical protein [Acidaminococcaceae bacterium]